MANSNNPPAEALINDVRRAAGHFEPNPYRQLGEGDSAHGVMFGVMPEHGEVAVKPFYSGAVKARIEARNLVAVKERGFDALEPLQVVSGGLASYLITRHREGLENLGQVPWAASVASPHLRGVLAPALTTAGETAAQWHNAGVTHGDMQAKNMIFGSNGESVYADAEKTQLNSPAVTRTRLAHRDLTKLGHSVLDRGLLADRSPKYRAGFLTDALVDPYLDLVKPELFALDPQTRRAALEDWWVQAVQEGRAPSTKLHGILNEVPGKS